MARRIRKWRSSIQFSLSTMRRSKSVVLLPLLLFLCLSALGVERVWNGLNSNRNRARQDASTLAFTTAAGYRTDLHIAALSVLNMATIVGTNPDVPTVLAQFPDVAQSIAFLQDSEGFDFTVLHLQMAPQGVVSAIYPMTGQEGALGHNLLEDPARRPDALEAIRSQHLTFAGPLNLVQGGRAVIYRYAIFVPGVPESERFNSGIEPHECPEACYVRDTFSRFWGFSVALVDLDAVTAGSRLDYVESQGYDWKIVKQGGSEDDEDSLVASAPGAAPRLHAPVVAEIPIVAGVMWELHLSPSSGRWRSRWGWLMFPVVVAAAAVVAALLCAMLISRKQHEELLLRMLPKKIMQQLQRGETVVDSYENVTVLFCDMVSYTDISTHVTPLEMAVMLNRLYGTFDALTDKHGLHKIDTIGDAFLLVGGCPDVIDPILAAERVAMCAQDMLRSTSDFRSPTGSRVRVRFGIHSGPVVTGVLGRKNPKFTLYGDTVNTASRMESHGVAGRIHASHATVRLLINSKLPFRLEPRGAVDIKGKGRMVTFFLEPEPGSNTQEEVRVIQVQCEKEARRIEEEAGARRHVRSVLRSTSEVDEPSVLFQGRRNTAPATRSDKHICRHSSASPTLRGRDAAAESLVERSTTSLDRVL